MKLIWKPGNVQILRLSFVGVRAQKHLYYIQGFTDSLQHCSGCVRILCCALWGFKITAIIYIQLCGKSKLQVVGSFGISSVPINKDGQHDKNFSIMNLTKT